jgi:prophage tail gpP-like protein
MSGNSIPQPPSTRRLALSVAGMVLTRWMSVSVTRNLRDIAGSFSVTYMDSGREAQSFSPDLDTPPFFQIVKEGMPCSVALDGTMVLSGFIDEVELDWQGASLSCTITGRDATGDLVDCAASPNGPVEFRNVSTLQIAQAICLPFAISASQDVTTANIFPLFGIDADETALSAIEKAARQDALLVTSNGVGGLILTQGGSTRAPASLTRPGNILGGGGKASWAQRFSDYYVKGQTNSTVIRKSQVPLMTPATDPRSGLTFPIETETQQTTTESTVAIMTGHAIDPQITRYRPTVRMVKTQAGAATVQQQAEWALRVAKGMGSTLNYRVADWRAGPANALWLPNQLSNVNDAWVNLNQDMLISGVTYRYDGTNGEMTEIELAGPTAFDRIDEPASDPRYIVARKPKSFGPTRQG